ncbi:MAG: hypothetical protein NTZ87_03260 [Candidatus Nomurabacteria bacterium]|nr:hypothetical protein [Candidatus Nomurabacteria bacterium]
MNKINTKSIIFNLGILAVSASLMIMSPTQSYGYNSYNSTSCSEGGCNTVYNNAYSQPVTNNPTPVINPTNQSSNNSNTSTNNSNASVKKTSNVTMSGEVSKANENNNNLAANAIFGSNSFLPNSLIQWIFVAIIILIIVILVRRVYGGNEKYNSTPLKHA